eukprot:m.253175 g.253175  ORF g.253175 m.253175 type:complete len:104 (+) comp17532_c0_seq6:20-331(+)
MMDLPIQQANKAGVIALTVYSDSFQAGIERLRVVSKMEASHSVPARPCSSLQVNVGWIRRQPSSSSAVDTGARNSCSLGDGYCKLHQQPWEPEAFIRREVVIY